MTDGLEVRRVVETDDGWTAVVQVATDSPWFDGHFPGEPVLPAMAQIGLAARLFAATGASGRPVALPNLRLAGQVRPGDRLSLRLAHPDDAGRAAFHLEKAEGKVSNGVMQWDDTAPEEPEPPRSPEEPESPRSPEETGAAGRHEGRGSEDHLPSPNLLPHAAPSLLATEVLEVGDGHVLCRGAVPAANAAVRDGTAGPWMALELAAQASGLLRAADAGPDGEIRIGYIVRIRNAHFHRADLPADTPLVARVDHDGGGGPLTLYRARVELDGAEVTSATLGTFLPPP